jgi:hypothetical protein
VHRTEFQAIGFSVASSRRPGRAPAVRLQARAKPTPSIYILCFFVAHIPSAPILRPCPERSSGGCPSSEERPSFAHALANFVRTQTLIPCAAFQVLLRQFSFRDWFFSSLQGFLSAH